MSLLDFTLSEAVVLTDSEYGYLYHYDENTELFVNHAWSDSVMRQCTVKYPQTVYDLASTGCWGDVVRYRRPVIMNDYSASHPRAKGLPEGHIRMSRWMSVPIEVDDRVVGVAGVANKPEPYDEHDVHRLSVLVHAAWAFGESLRGCEAAVIESNEAVRETAILASADQTERRQLADLLHDEVSQPLAAAAIRLGVALSEQRGLDAAKNLRAALRAVEGALSASRDLTSDLSPQILREFGLPAALTALVKQVSGAGLSCSAGGPESVGEMNPAIEEFCFDAVRRLLDGIARDSEARHAEVRWDAYDGLLRLEVADDGNAFRYVEASDRLVIGRGTGVFGLRERAEYFGGHIEVEQTPRGRTAVAVVVPLQVA